MASVCIRRCLLLHLHPNIWNRTQRVILCHKPENISLTAKYFSEIRKTISNKIDISKSKKMTDESQNHQAGGRDDCKYLAAFDFDYTVVAQNSDTVVRDMLPPDKFPSDSIMRNSGWTAYMAKVFAQLHECNFTPSHIRDKIRCIPEVPGFVRLLKRLHQCHNFDMIIISDSNSVFIEEWLRAHGLADCFMGIYTNPAKFEEDGLLTIRPYHHQTECKLSAANLCKGQVLDHFVVERDLRDSIRYEQIFYVGDGNNDICPVLKLRVGDVACARRDFALEKKFAKNRDKMSIRAGLIVWVNGFDLMEQLQAKVKRLKVEN